jgi:hypothetical protein
LVFRFEHGNSRIQARAPPPDRGSPASCSVRRGCQGPSPSIATSYGRAPGTVHRSASSRAGWFF